MTARNNAIAGRRTSTMPRVRPAGRQGTSCDTCPVAPSGTRRAALLALALVAAACAAPPGAELSSAPVTVTTIPVDPAIEDLMNGAGFTTAGRRLFLAARPQLQDAESLARDCARPEAATEPGSTHTYGCVVRGRIHIRTFANPAVHDLMYVVAAHELLHVVYVQLSAAERVRLNADLLIARTGNDRLEERLTVYAETSDDTPNEVHSVLGTEFGDLSVVLEAHFSLYFDRSVVLAAFRSTLGDREDELRRLEAQINDMDARLKQLAARLDTLRSTNVAAYNTAVAEYNSLVRQHNAVIRQYNSLLDEYKRLTES